MDLPAQVALGGLHCPTITRLPRRCPRCRDAMIITSRESVLTGVPTIRTGLRCRPGSTSFFLFTPTKPYVVSVRVLW